MIGIYNMMGNCYLLQSKSDSAQYCYEYCIELLENIDNYLDKSFVLHNLSVGYMVLGDTIKAKQYLHEALSYPLNDRDKSKITQNLARINFHNKDSFYYYINKSFDLIQNEENLELKRSLYLLYSKFEESQEVYKLALGYHKNYVEYLKNERRQEYESSLNLLQNKFYLKEFEQKNMRLLISQQRLFLIGALVIILLLLAIIYIFRQRKIIEDIRKSMEKLQEMSLHYNEQEKSLRNVVLQNFQILKKVALLESYMINNETNSKFIRKFNEIVYGQDSLDWEQLYETINSLHDNLFNKIKKEFLSLTDQEFKICCLTIARLSNSEIGIILNNSASTIQYRKTYIRKKLGIPHQGNIGDFFQGYFDKQSFQG